MSLINISHSDEIFAIMNIEMNNALCKCFTHKQYNITTINK